MLVDRDIETDEADTPEDDHLINNEIAELTKYVEMITSTVRDMESPVTTTSARPARIWSVANEMA